MEEIRFKIWTEDNIEGVAKMEAECFSKPWPLDAFEREYFENDRALYVVGEDLQGNVVSYGGLWKILDEGHITNIAVQENFRGENIGFKTVEYLISTGENLGIKAFTLEVRSTNKVAISLYEKLGFISVGVRKNYYEDEDGIIMWRI